MSEWKLDSFSMSRRSGTHTSKRRNENLIMRWVQHLTSNKSNGTQHTSRTVGHHAISIIIAPSSPHTHHQQQRHEGSGGGVTRPSLYLFFAKYSFAVLKFSVNNYYFFFLLLLLLFYLASAIKLLSRLPKTCCLDLVITGRLSNANECKDWQKVKEGERDDNWLGIAWCTKQVLTVS